MSGKLKVCVFVVLLAASALFPGLALAQGKPPANEAERLHKLFGDDWKWAMHEFPEFATFVGYPGENHRWGDASLEAIDRRKR